MDAPLTRKPCTKSRCWEVLDHTWSDWFDGFRITCLDGETLLVGSVEDQSALLGILTKIISLGLTLISIDRIMEVGS